MLSYSIFLLMMTDVTPRSGTTPQLSMFRYFNIRITINKAFWPHCKQLVCS